MKSDDLYRKLEKSLKNVIIMTGATGIMLLFGIIIIFFDAEVQKSDADIQWGWAVCGVAAIILIAGIAAQTIFEPAELTFQAFNRTKYF